MKDVKLDPVEWDFRSIASEMVEDLLWVLVDYEFLRETPLAGQFEEWKKRQFFKWESGPGGEVSWYDGERLHPYEYWSPTIETTIGAVLKQGFEKLPFAVQERLMETFPGHNYIELEWIANCPEFPEPYANCAHYWTPPLKNGAPLVYIRKDSEKQGSGRLPMFSTSFNRVETIHVVVDWANVSPTVLKRQFSEWVDRNRPKDIRPIERRGTSRPPFERLKWLSAYRLHKFCGLGHREFQKFLKEYSRNRPVEGGADVLPIYEYASGWNGAINKARSYLEYLT